MTETIGRVSVLGLGYVGLSNAAVLASQGVQVIGVDVDPDRVERIDSGVSPIDEPGLDSLIADAVTDGRLIARDEPVKADVFIIAVPTPVGHNHKPDISYVRAAVDCLAPVLQAGNLITIESTCPVGTTETVCDWLASTRPDLTFPHSDGDASDIRVAYCPERILPGRALEELVANDRVIGGISPACAAAAKRLYELFVEGTCYVTNARTAELVKLAENAFRDVNIAFANEISLVCDALDIDPWELIGLANRHPRGRHSEAWPWSGGTLYPHRSVVHRRHRTPSDAADSGRETGQQRYA